MRLTVLLSIILILQGCTVAYYKTDDELNSPETSLSKGKCNIEYFLEISAEMRQRTTGTNERAEWAEKAESKYINSIENVFSSVPCSSNQVSAKEHANFIINVKISPYHSALSQEWLTGLSFGLIPSWGTRPNEYTYTFRNLENSASHKYSIDNVSFNHLVLFPVFWVTFLTLDETKEFERALENFIENS
ncbi:hypothetical protein [Zhongshania arctica]|uniref:Lipoprotein n=1 Tax=Zhongshania arctica TaxID=3238302 RepID=A0ABV3TS15_9GAMM